LVQVVEHVADFNWIIPSDLFAAGIPWELFEELPQEVERLTGTASGIQRFHFFGGDRGAITEFVAQVIVGRNLLDAIGVAWGVERDACGTGFRDAVVDRIRQAAHHGGHDA
jgi:hypothetical protein